MRTLSSRSGVKSHGAAMTLKRVVATTSDSVGLFAACRADRSGDCLLKIAPVLDEGDQVGHLLVGEVFFEALGH